MPSDALAARVALCEAGARIDRLDAEVLLAHLLGIERLALLADLDRRVDAPAYARLVARRAAGEPVAYLTGVREFWSLPLRVTPDVLVPRPDSETLIEAAIGTGLVPRTVLDLGTGSGALLLAALAQWPAAVAVGVDRSERALRVARANAGVLDFGERALFLCGDWGTALEATFDLILCNPPYVQTGDARAADAARHEPHAALFAGADGLAAYRAILPDLPRLLARHGACVLELGEGQAPAVRALAAAAGLEAAIRRDLAGIARAMILQAARPGLVKNGGSA
jgi:release factor glutamine methyltransferase